MRINVDSLGGAPSKPNCTASKTYRAVCHFGNWGKKEEPKSLRVMGFVLDKIEKITRHLAMFGNIPANWPQFAGWIDHSENPPKPF
jgi:hypothetical protein